MQITLRKIVLSLLAVGVASINPTALEKVTGYNVGASLLEASAEYGKYAEKLVNFESRFSTAISDLNFDHSHRCLSELCNQPVSASAALQVMHSQRPQQPDFTPAFMQMGAEPCGWPMNTDYYSLITRDNATVHANKVRKGLAIGGFLIDGTPTECGEVQNMSIIAETFIGERWNFTELCIVGQPLNSKIYWPQMEFLATNAEPNDYPGGYKVVVFNTGGTYTTDSFYTPGLDATPGGKNVLVVFNTDMDIVLDASASGEPFLATVLAPFSLVTMIARTERIDGTIIAREFGGTTIIQEPEAEEGFEELTGDLYEGPITCTEAWTPPSSTSTASKILIGCPEASFMTMTGCTCMSAWMHMGQAYQCCDTTPDREIPWCPVREGADCDMAVEAADGSYWWDACPTPLMMVPIEQRPPMPVTLSPEMPGTMPPGTPAPMMPGTPGTMMPGTPGTMIPVTMAPETMMPGTPGTMMPVTMAPETMMPGTPGTMMPGTPGTMMPGTPGTMMPGTPGTMMPATPGTMMPGTPGTMMPGTPGTMMPGTPGTMMPVTMAPETMMPGTPGTMVPGTPGTMMPGTPAPGTMMPGTPGTMMPGTPGTMVPGTPGTMMPGTPGTMMPGTPGTMMPGTPAPGTMMPGTPAPGTMMPGTPAPMMPGTPASGTMMPGTPSTTAPEMCVSNITEHNCKCQQTWMYAGNEMECCQYTPDHDKPWCYVVDGVNCPNSIKTSGTGGYWDNCAPYAPTTTTTTAMCVSNITEHGCHCMQTWLYGGEDQHCCQYTPDNELPWCYVSDGVDCPGAIKTSGTGGYWDNCAPYAPTTTTTTGMCVANITEHGCHCMQTWLYGGEDQHCCQYTPDNELPWCYVSDGVDCPGAIKTSGTGGYWDNCAPYRTTTTTTAFCLTNITDHGCHCMDTWLYNGKDEHCCQYTPDNEKPWCYVADGVDCQGAIKTSGTGGYWDNCPEP